MTSNSPNQSGSPARKVVFNPYARKKQKPNAIGANNGSFHRKNEVSTQPPRYYQAASSSNQQTLNVARLPSASERVNTDRVNDRYPNNVAQSSSFGSSMEGPLSQQSTISNGTTQSVGSNQKSNNQGDSFGFDSIDWDEACRVADHASAVALSQSEESQFTLNSTCEGRVGTSGSPTKKQPYAQSTSSSSPVVDLTQQDDEPQQSTRIAAINHHQNNPSSPSKWPPRIPSVGTSRQHTNNMQSLRPNSWTNNDASSPGMDRKVAASSPQLSQQQLTRQGTLVSSPAAKMHNLIAQLPKELRFSPDVVQPAKDGRTPELIKHARLGQTLANGWTLFDHQRRAICMGLRMRRCILALDMGLGKTLIGCCWARSFQKTFSNCKVIVIAPVSLKAEWARTAEQATEIKVKGEEKKPKKRKRKGQAAEDEEPICIDEDDGTPKMEIFSWAKVPTEVESSVDSYVVVCDEAHQLQSMAAARTKDLLKLVQSQRCVGVILLTGTPMKNGKPSNLFPLLRAVRHPFGNYQRAYELQFCAGRQKQFGRGPPIWDASGASNLSQLRSLVSSHLLHLKKEDCLKSLPKATREFQHVPVSQRQKKNYDDMLKRVLALFASHGAGESDKSDALLGQLQQLRCQGAIARVDASVDIAKNVLEKEPAVVLFTSFVRVAKALQEKLARLGWEGEVLTGETPPKKRQPMVDNFQNGVSPVIVCTFGAGGVGLTLTAARTVILVDRPWTPGDVHQAEDRVRRIGQRFPVKFIWVSSFDVDKHIDAMLESKSQTSNAVLASEGNNDESFSAPPPKISMFHLLRRLLDAQSAGTGNQSAASSNRAGLSQTCMDSHSSLWLSR
ncbi:annealing helicase and endonuclease ZRANB3 [Seminavis robusta]|uniref:Annealing helicase and endonuclease ZRANB3 n=1 Tax=Seminavis robusta TaxID=568900 RepID=A0A9N8H543_9STRA|nr:annealing helicase and endonuclease ZRANB3 [Seminavis robusta]|eukprot:Sro17_g012590.1 annealing helicase and endonuclease ZRANB3 (842) ;mRNA; r:156686-159392